jgi:hypothetical protein
MQHTLHGGFNRQKSAAASHAFYGASNIGCAKY